MGSNKFVQQLESYLTNRVQEAVQNLLDREALEHRVERFLNAKIEDTLELILLEKFGFAPGSSRHMRTADIETSATPFAKALMDQMDALVSTAYKNTIQNIDVKTLLVEIKDSDLPGDLFEIYCEGIRDKIYEKGQEAADILASDLLDIVDGERILDTVSSKLTKKGGNTIRTRAKEDFKIK